LSRAEQATAIDHSYTALRCRIWPFDPAAGVYCVGMCSHAARQSLEKALLPELRDKRFVENPSICSKDCIGYVCTELMM